MNLEERVKEMEASGSYKGFGSHKPKSQTPDPRIRHCESCQQDVEVTDDWRCPTPGCLTSGQQTSMVYAVVKMPCPKCGRERAVQMVGNRPLPLHCQCGETAREKRARLQREDAAKEDERTRAMHLRNAKKSYVCFHEEHRGGCDLEREHFGMCYTCPRWTHRFQALRREAERASKS